MLNSQNTQKNGFLSGFITIAGRPNVGKSTLLNTLCGEKIAIVSNKPQTTRRKIEGVVTGEGFQAVFVDTPGIHTPKRKLDKYMQKSIDTAVSGVDIIYFLVEPGVARLKKDTEILKSFAGSPALFLIINKTDTVKERDILPVIEAYKSAADFNEIIPISAKTGENAERLLEVTKKYLPKGPMYFPEDYITDQPERSIAAEIIREKALYALDEEVPHGIAVEITAMKERESGEIADIEANIYCEKKTHKGIIIGKKGEMLKKIGSGARRDIETLLGMRVNLQLWVKVKDNWRDNDYLLRAFGYDIKKV